MILYPAIDLKDGGCVRLLRGEMGTAKLFNQDPVDQARVFEAAGCEWLHIVDLNGAFSGAPVNIEAVEAIISSISIPIQLGGGIRDMETASRWLDSGVERVIFGTVAVQSPNLVREACRLYPGRIAVGIDARNGYVATQGWACNTEVSAVDLAEEFGSAGVAALIYTDINRDGAMEGPNKIAVENFARATEVPVIASGGISSVNDLIEIKGLTCAGVNGVISGRAIYEGQLNIHDALEVLRD